MKEIESELKNLRGNQSSLAINEGLKELNEFLLKLLISLKTFIFNEMIEIQTMRKVSQKKIEEKYEEIDRKFKGPETEVFSGNGFEIGDSEDLEGIMGFIQGLSKEIVDGIGELSKGCKSLELLKQEFMKKGGDNNDNEGFWRIIAFLMKKASLEEEKMMNFENEAEKREKIRNLHMKIEGFLKRFYGERGRNAKEFEMKVGGYLKENDPLGLELVESKDPLLKTLSTLRKYSNNSFIANNEGFDDKPFEESKVKESLVKENIVNESLVKESESESKSKEYIVKESQSKENILKELMMKETIKETNQIKEKLFSQESKKSIISMNNSQRSLKDLTVSKKQQRIILEKQGFEEGIKDNYHNKTIVKAEFISEMMPKEQKAAFEKESWQNEPIVMNTKENEGNKNEQILDKKDMNKEQKKDSFLIKQMKNEGNFAKETMSEVLFFNNELKESRNEEKMGKNNFFDQKSIKIEEIPFFQHKESLKTDHKETFLISTSKDFKIFEPKQLKTLSETTLEYKPPIKPNNPLNKMNDSTRKSQIKEEKSEYLNKKLINPSIKVISQEKIAESNKKMKPEEKNPPSILNSEKNASKNEDYYINFLNNELNDKQTVNK